MTVRSLRLACGALAAAAAMAAAAGCGGGGEDAFPTAIPSPTQPPPASERVTFETADGVRIAASFWPADSPSIVVFAHMRGSDRNAWGPAVERALDRGFAALAFDFRGHGESSDGDADLGKIDLDLEAAVTYARQRGYARVYVVGASMGGTAALAVAARQDLAGVVVMSSPEGFEGIDARAALSSVREPLLFIAATGDQPYRRAVEAMHEAALGTKRLVLVPGNDHGTDLLENRQTRDETLDAIMSFLGVP
ncbi:MAG TPA: alpha/beta fold hydrolase [Candidatus Tectomicrobia bacterium]|nr:alpha/beta fold hydrolase [Candidatus Tectomicrobia bacterium]